jgi:hypothetical protein
MKGIKDCYIEVEAHDIRDWAFFIKAKTNSDANGNFTFKYYSNLR